MNTVITVGWPANPVEEGVTKYQVYESKDGAPMAFKANVTPPSHELVISNPLPGVYAWAVKAENFVGMSPLGEVSEGPAIPSTPPAPTITVVVS